MRCFLRSPRCGKEARFCAGGLVTGALHWGQRSRRAVSVSAARCHNCKIMLSCLDQTPRMDAGPGRRRRFRQRLQLPAGVEGVYALPSHDHVEHHEARWPAVMAAGCSRVMLASSTMHRRCLHNKDCAAPAGNHAGLLQRQQVSLQPCVMNRTMCTFSVTRRAVVSACSASS